jgi:4-hydroxyphenylacetate 3-monooxygenase
MTRSGREYVESLRDARQVFIDGERVEDVTTHPAFRESVRSIARLYDEAADPANRELMTYPIDPGDPDSERANVAFMIPRSEQDLVDRRRGLRHWAELSYGLMGRSPDHVAGFLAGFAGNSGVFARAGREYADNVIRFYEFARDNDLYLTYVIVPPQIDRSKPAHQQADPHLYASVSEERDDGIVVKGAQMLGTGAAVSDWIHLSRIVPLGPGDEDYAISVVMPIAADGVKVFSRRGYAQAATSVYDYPLSTRFDETDSLVVFDDVFVPWESVFVYRDLELIQAQWWETCAHILGNSQAQIRFAVKLDFMTGLARRIAEMNGIEGLPPVRASLAEIAAHAAMASGLVAASEHNAMLDGDGVMRPGNEETYANMVLAAQIYPKLLNMFRELCGGGLIQLPSSVEDFGNPEIAEQLERYVQSPGVPARERVKLMKLAWDLVGSEFASRHHQYEMFYAGAPFLVKQRMYQNYDFDRSARLVEDALAGYDLDGLRDARVAEPG